MTLKVTMPGIRSGLTFSQLRLNLCFLMYCWVLADPVCGYFLKNCTIRGNLILCYNRNLEVIPSDIPRKVSNLDLAMNKISKIEKLDFTDLSNLKILNMSKNQISQVDDEALGHLDALQELGLSHNRLTTLSDHLFQGLANLSLLHLDNNLIATISSSSFQPLSSLKTVNLTKNNLYNMKEVQAIVQLPHLQELQDLVNGSRLKVKALTDIACHIPTLNVLRLEYNNIGNLSEEFVQSCKHMIEVDISNTNLFQLSDFSFRPLEQIRTLKMGHNRLSSVPKATRNVPTLKVLDLSFNIINKLGCSDFSNLTGLTQLIIFHNQISNLPGCVFQDLKELRILKLGSNKILTLNEAFMNGLHKLETLVTFLQVSKNDITVVNETVLQSLPALTYLDMQDNAFTCGCSDAWFVQWMESNNQTQVVGAGEFTCNYPADLKDTKLLDVELQFCTVDLGLYCYISTTCLVLLTLVASFAYHFLKWQVIYGYYLFLAFLYDTKQRKKHTPHGCQYDAFISYNAHDEPWVLRELLPELEGQQGWKLCLHHRDFQPGKPIIDNIMDGIYGSRKTICVISHRYLESEWCSREIQVASFRLFDEQKDVLILVFLEEIPTHQLSPYHRMRKLVKRRTYLSWPRNGEHIVLFWQQLRLALETKDGPAEENPILSGVQAL
ncbi:unnamed protein product [Oncorhynchus mykiss]|uniref:TIR domain-containing protein n=1 Tax=Oncorhynchus mykiss TaxID=8022 RepID=A0A060Y3B9_ONCMY|nr:unnamed protein product [Oncorhynchus mykiss]